MILYTLTFFGHPPPRTSSSSSCSCSFFYFSSCSSYSFFLFFFFLILFFLFFFSLFFIFFLPPATEDAEQGTGAESKKKKGFWHDSPSSARQTPRSPGCVRRCPLPPLHFPPSRPLDQSDRPAASLLQGRCEGGSLLGQSPDRFRNTCRLDGDGWGRCPITGSCASPAATARLSEPVRVCECGVPASGGASRDVGATCGTFEPLTF